MNFQPKTEQEIAENKLWPRGDYDFEIMDAREKNSGAGNEMIELKVKITRPDGSSRVVTDYVLPKRPEKFLHCCAACGLLDKYRKGLVADDDFVAKRGKIKLGIEKDRKHTYPDKNVVLDYICASGTTNGNSAGPLSFKS
jgi:hypothetical protein